MPEELTVAEQLQKARDALDKLNAYAQMKFGTRRAALEAEIARLMALQS